LPGRAPGPAATPPRHALLPPAIALAAYAVTFPFVPRLASALLAFLALGFAWSLWRHGTPYRPWTVGLGLLGLPMAASLQFYLGYPLRIASGGVALVLLRLGGAAVEREGVYLRAGDELVMIDAPCSGMRMLWAALLLACCLAALFRLRARATLLAVGAAGLLAVAGNGLRTAALFWADTRAPELPGFAHAGIGLVAFAMLAAALVAVARALAAREGRACAP
jgi:exosortase/archaeosortase family protein